MKLALVTSMLCSGLMVARGYAQQAEANKQGVAPEATRILIAATIEEDGLPHDLLLSLDPETGKWQRLAKSGGMFPRVSPDRLTVAFRGDDAVRNCTTDGGGSSANLFEITDVCSGPVWTPDGKHLYVSSVRQEFGGLVFRHENWKYSADGRNREKLKLPASDVILDVSPADARLLLTSSRRLVRLTMSELWLMRDDGKRIRRLSEPGGLNGPARFSPDGRYVVFIRSDGDGRSVFSVATDGTNRRKVFSETGIHVEDCCWSPDGKRMALVVSNYGHGPDGTIRHAIQRGEAARWRIVLIDAGGKLRDEAKLDAKIWSLRQIDWYAATN